ncbi:tetratricopeptide repeat protein [Flavobacterium sp. J49]|uniref:tetratricopeptide repeat protein n=1 Tax=Flavobacterium sp. J49 TaxID=2718534 RepID=UPI001593EE35|nr:tetratricopeptide repeat protein [Flavobacterium sp. J49]MBF6642052.1 tetratricopeptide repeat protein [Flavobacterium sp. J49]NIC03300.1 tetratricopeptide repeat protein [Flavobacterium sp. J49]
MKIKHIVLASTILVSVSTFAQKDELKVLKKIYTKEAPKPADVSEYKANLTKLEGLATEESDKVYAGFFKAMLPLVEISALGPLATEDQKSQIVTAKTVEQIEKGLNATLEFEKKSGKKVYTDDILAKVQLYKNEIINLAINLANQQKFQEASNVLYSSYLMDKKDQDNLFFAASYAINAVNYDLALEHYYELKKLNYTGETTVYFASTKSDNKEESFGGSKVLRDAAVKSGTHIKPREEKTPSRRGEIFKNIALILVDKGRVEEAKAAVAEARQANPEDPSLILTEADLYLKMNDFVTYTKLVNEALDKNPNNVDLIYNLGVIAGNANKIDEAEKYYKKALELNPNYFNANLNLAELRLRADDKFVTEINKLGTSEKDNKRYEVLKAEREKNFKSVLPYLEKAVELEPQNEPAKKTLLSVYNALEMTDKYKALKAKM